MKMFAWFHRLAGFACVAGVVILVGGLLLGGCQENTKSLSGLDAASLDKLARRFDPLYGTSVYDIPRVPVKAIDAADWGDLGFCAVLADPDLGTAAPEFHAARCRLGWNEQGLLVYMDVRDVTPTEGPNIWDGDSVEIVVGREAKGNSDRFQYLVSAGRTAKFDRPRIGFSHILHTLYRRWPDAPPEGTKYATRITDGGYVVELLIPWTAMNVTPTVGLEVGVQLQTCDSGSPKEQYARLTSQFGGPNKAVVDLQRIRLAEAGAGSEPVLAAMGREMLPAAVNKPAEAALRIVADGSFAGQTATVEIDGKAMGKLTFGKAISGWTEGLMAWSVSLGDKLPQSATVVLPGGKRATLALGNLLKSRREQFNRLELTFRPWVFAGEKLPPVAFKQPLLADILSGSNYTIKTRYFDADARPVEKADRPGRYGAVVEITALGETKTHYFTLYRVADDKALDWRNWWLDTNLRVRFENMPEGFGVNPKVWTDDPGRIFGSEFKIFFRGSLDNDGFFAAMLASLSELPEEVLTGKVPLKPSQGAHASHEAYVVKLKQAISDKPIYPYTLVKPQDYDKATDKRWPLLVCLHGAGSSGFPMDWLWQDGANAQEWIRKDLPLIVVAPHSPPGEGWQPAAVIAMVNQLIKTMRVDPDRVYLTGISMGGFGTWNTAASYLDRFAAIVPLCGGMDAEQAIWLKDMPIWAFHGDADTLVPVECTRAPIKRLREAAGEAGAPHIKYTEMPGVWHDITHVYREYRELYDWLLQQRRPAR